jgi:hypothetical protein
MVYDMKSNIKLSSMISMMHTFSRAAAAEQQHSSSREVCVRYSVYSMYLDLSIRLKKVHGFLSFSH